MVLLTPFLFCDKIQVIHNDYVKGMLNMKCYDGNKPYVFVSYAHNDKELVCPFISELMNRGYRVWYDEGIYPSEEWPESVAYHLYHAESVIFFISNSFCNSKNCKREVNFAIDKDKDMFAVFLESVDLSFGMQMQLGTTQSIYWDKDNDIAQNINKILINKTLSKSQLIMSKEEFNDFFDIKIAQNTLINQISIAIGIIKHNGCVLMLKRNNNENGLIWGFPASMVKPHENIGLRIVKETFSETGIRTKFVDIIGTRVHPNTKAIVHYCALEYVDGFVENLDEYENEDAQWVPLSCYQSYITSDLYIKVKEYLEGSDHG